MSKKLTHISWNLKYFSGKCAKCFLPNYDKAVRHFQLFFNSFFAITKSRAIQLYAICHVCACFYFNPELHIKKSDLCEGHCTKINYSWVQEMPWSSLSNWVQWMNFAHNLYIALVNMRFCFQAAILFTKTKVPSYRRDVLHLLWKPPVVALQFPCRGCSLFFTLQLSFRLVSCHRVCPVRKRKDENSG